MDRYLYHYYHAGCQALRSYFQTSISAVSLRVETYSFSASLVYTVGTLEASLSDLSDTKFRILFHVFSLRLCA